MKKSCVAVLLLLGLGLTVMPAGTAHAAPGIFAPFRCTIEPVSYDPVSGRVELDVAVGWDTLWNIHAECNDLITVRVVETDGLEYVGPEEWQVLVHPPEFVSTRVSLTVPVDDTSGLTLETQCGKDRFIFPRYFVTSGDSIKAVWDDPRKWVDVGEPKSLAEQQADASAELMRRWAEQQAKPAPPPGGTTRTYIPIKPGDSALFDSLPLKEQQQLRLMRSKEDQPLAGSPQETIWIGQRVWVRYEGEREFHRARTYTDEQIREEVHRRHDSVAANPPNNIHDVSLDLSDSSDFAFARDLLGDLIKGDTVGIYRVKLHRPQLIKLIEHGIEYHRDIPWTVPRGGGGTPPPKKNSDNHPPQKSSSGGRSDLLFFDGFEGRMARPLWWNPVT